MTSRERVQDARRPDDDTLVDGAGVRGPRILAPASRPDVGVGSERVSGVARKPGRDSDAHAHAIDLLVGAAADREWLSQRNESACGTRGERGAVAALAAANERFAAREAWVKYIEHGY
jgi:hypothetical protein